MNDNHIHAISHLQELLRLYKIITVMSKCFHMKNYAIIFFNCIKNKRLNVIC